MVGIFMTMVPRAIPLIRPSQNGSCNENTLISVQSLQEYVR
jgi:hypothetical protein